MDEREVRADLLLIPVTPAYRDSVVSEVKHCLDLGEKSPLTVVADEDLEAGPIGGWKALVLGCSAGCTLGELRSRFPQFRSHMALAVARQIVAAFHSLQKGAATLAHDLFRYDNVVLDPSGAVRLVWNWESENFPITFSSCARQQFWFSREASGQNASAPSGWPLLREELVKALDRFEVPDEVLRGLRNAKSPEEAQLALVAIRQIQAEDSLVVSVAVNCWIKNEDLPDWLITPPAIDPDPPAASPMTQKTPIVGLQMAFRVPGDYLGAWPLGHTDLLVWQSNRMLAVISQNGAQQWSDEEPSMLRIVASSLEGGLAAAGWEGNLRWFQSGKLQGSGNSGWTVGDLKPMGNGWIAGSWNGRLYNLSGGLIRPILPAAEDGICRIAVSRSERFATLSMQGVVAIYTNGKRIAQTSLIPGAKSLAFASGMLVVLTEHGLVSIKTNGQTSSPDRLPSRGMLRLVTSQSTGECFVVNEQGQSWLIDQQGTYPRGPALRSHNGFLAVGSGIRRYVAVADIGGYSYWREGFEVQHWPDALSAEISTDGSRVVVVRLGAIEAYEDPV